MLTDFLATLAAASPAVSSPRKAKTVPPPLPAQALAPPPSRNGEGGEDRRAKQARHTELLAVIGCDPLFFFCFCEHATGRLGHYSHSSTCSAELLFFLLCCSAGKGTAADNIEMERLELELG